MVWDKSGSQDEIKPGEEIATLLKPEPGSGATATVHFTRTWSWITYPFRKAYSWATAPLRWVKKAYDSLTAPLPPMTPRVKANSMTLNPDLEKRTMEEIEAEFKEIDKGWGCMDTIMMWIWRVCGAVIFLVICWMSLGEFTLLYSMCNWYIVILFTAVLGVAWKTGVFSVN